MIAIDTNLLVYAHRADNPYHEAARAVITGVAEGPATWCIPWPCIHEFYSIVTHPRIYAPPSSPQQANAQIEIWCESPSLMLLSETDEYWRVLGRLLDTAKVQGPLVHDARIAALCKLHGVKTLWSADRDFSRFQGLATHNPLIANQ